MYLNSRKYKNTNLHESVDITVHGRLAQPLTNRRYVESTNRYLVDNRIPTN